MTSSTAFSQAISQNGWTIPQIAECLKQVVTADPLNDEDVCRTLLAWMDDTPYVANHAIGRRYTRLQFLENTLSAAGYYLTRRDVEPWLAKDGNWRPNELLPYTPIDPRLVEQEARIDQLEHDLHQMEVARNRAKAEVAHVMAERDHFLAINSEHIYKSVSADYQNSASWRVSKPLRRLMAWRRGQKFVEVAVQKPEAEALIPPWEQLGYSIEKAWQAAPEEDFDRSDYTEWLRRYDNPTDAEIATLKAKAQTLAAQPSAPLFSLLMAVEPLNGGANLPWLEESVASVQAQIYPKWELCIAASSQIEAAFREVLDGMATMDQRIKLVYASSDQGLLNAALDVAEGDWVGLLNAMNKIAIQAINTPAKVIFEGKKCDIIYTDSDKLITTKFSPKFERAAPDFKPDWNLDLFLSSGSSHNYTQDLCFFKADLVRELGGFGSGLNSSFELMSRVIARQEQVQIHHIPQVLVHVRQTSAGSEMIVPHKIQHALPVVPPLVSLIIPTKNNAALLRQCIDSILSKTSYTNYEILVVDNGSDKPETLDYLKTLNAHPQIRVIRDNYAFNYSALNNYAATFAKGEVLALVNDDIEVASPDWLTEMVGHALRPGVGAVGARLWYPDQTIQHAGMVLVGGVARHIHKHLPKGKTGFNGRAVLTQNFSAVTGACLVVKKALFEQVGGLNDQELAVGFNDVDFCLKLGEAGFRNVWTPHAELIHHESATRGQDSSPEKQRRAEKELRYMRKRWGDKLSIDPAYSPNLSDGRDDMSFAWPPRK
ncbi:MAG: glycosyltransferase family 2 protein [Burkholderiaceae bacterium]